MDGRNDRDIILKFTLIKALKELVVKGDVSEIVAKKYMKIFDKAEKTKVPEDVLAKLLAINSELMRGGARHHFKKIELAPNDIKINKHLEDIFIVLQNKDQGVSPALDLAILIEQAISKAKKEEKRQAEEVAENMARLAAASKSHK